ncbi:cadherin repeat domain-containing protein [Roseomonas sp. KE2513]|uniref:cadherin repeat domain-containing protein n=1 Tax=Roseomonas sp. KE2513 TaxID=2479202 RepID=UPI0018DF76D8|nr:cadherin repeat domain-containing protein [Roseomonas sp. KE2513]MBI0534222.1 cadherin repeat domain-containing protein [Roseomonas sp. KE2513]
MAITAAGIVPASILENNARGDWVATLFLSGGTGITDVALTGQDASLFLAALGTGGRVTITPALTFDREAYAPGADPVFSFSLSIRDAGTWTALPDILSVTLQGVDDAAPSGLRFSSGGSVLETDIAGTIGTLTADDPDSPSGNITYSVLWPDAAFFEIVGNTLKLRAGVDLLRQGGTVREVMIEASDGLHEAAFTLPVTVVNVTNQDGPTPSPPASPPYSPPVAPPPSPPVTVPVSPPAAVDVGQDVTPVSPPASPPISPPVSPPPSSPAASIVVTHTGGSTDVAEGGATDTFTVQLSRMPTAAVTLQIGADSDLTIAAGTVTPAAKSISFTIQPSDWATPRVVTVGALDDNIVEGPETAHLTFSITSTDLSFKALTGTTMNVGIADNDANYGLNLRETGINTAVVEGAAGDLFTIALSIRPTAPVMLEILGGADLAVLPSGGKAAPSYSITFTPTDWANPRAVMVQAIEDGIIEGTEVTGVTFRLTSEDLHYNNLKVAALPVLVADAAVARGHGAAAAAWAADLLRPAPTYDPAVVKPAAGAADVW